MRKLGLVVAVLGVVLGSSPTAIGAAPRNPPGVPPLQLTQLAPFAVSAMAVRPGDPNIYVTELQGFVDALAPGQSAASRVLDLTAEVRAGVEQGLLGLVFSVDGSKLYVLYTALDDSTRLEEYAFANGVADPASRRRLLDIPRKQREHNGGQLAFGPDGLLYIGLGDGGGSEDEGPGHARPDGNAQTLDRLLGKILRIDPTPTADAPYTIPPDNPFADGGGRPEVWSYGLRNPWRFSFDRVTGDLWIADVGEAGFDEIDLARAAEGAGRGVNFGWNVFEGRRRLRDGMPTGGSHQRPLRPVVHRRPCTAVIGGYVYRGQRIPGFDGIYLWGDFCRTKLHWLRQEDGVVVEQGVLDIEVQDLASFGEGADGELYVLSLASGLFRIDPKGS